MKICHFTVHSRYDIRVFIKECRSLAKANYNVTLVVPDNKDDEIVDNVQIKSTGFNKKNRLHRIFFGKKKMMKYLKQVDADIYHFHDPELIPLAIKLVKFGKKVIYDRHENFTTIVQDKEWILNIIKPIVQKTFNDYEEKKAKQFDLVIGVTPNLTNDLQRLNKNIVIITNYPIVDNLDKQKKSVLSIEDEYIAFAGGVMDLWCHDRIINVIDKCENIKYKIAGPSTEEYLKKISNLKNYKYVDYYGIVPQEKVKQIYEASLAGMCIAKYANNTMGKEGTLGNTKIFEIMLSGIPVICTNFKLWEEIIEKYKCGICVDPYDSRAISNAINYLYKHKDEAKKMGENGRRAVLNNFNWSTQETKLFEAYKKIIG